MMKRLKITVYAFFEVSDESYQGHDAVKVEKQNIENAGISNYLETVEDIGGTYHIQRS